jgi:hypothetical protein
MDGEKDAQQVSIRDLAGVVGNLHHLGVAGSARADIRVTWVRQATPCIAGFHGDDSAQVEKNGLYAPEAAGAQNRSRIVCHVSTPLLAAQMAMRVPVGKTAKKNPLPDTDSGLPSISRGSGGAD